MEKNYILELTKDVLKSFEGGLKKGWYKFKDESMTVNKWLKLSDKEKGNYRIGLTELGKKEAKSDDLMFKIMSKKLYNDKDFIENLVKEVKCDKLGNIEIILTEEGEQVKKLYEVSGISFSDLIQKKLRKVINKEFTHYIVTNDKIIRGQLRL